ncbi:MAG: 4-hydroxy-tetrahydrodipicolinate reductase [Clostridiales bacterium]|nr:4-hydroxy-tetrahydrodipicolinate reductase [Clostridiales bacterium]
MIRIILNGYAGKLGKAIRDLTELPDCPAVITAGADINGDSSATGFPLFKTLKQCDISADVLVDCSHHSATPDVLNYAVENNIPVVICTTGITSDIEKLIEKAAETIPVFHSPNMSLSVSLAVNLAKRTRNAFTALGLDFDIEIIEEHHSGKHDAPSGTALLFANEINYDGKYNYVYGRNPQSPPRTENEIGIHAVRGGSIVGDHTVLFAQDGETLEIKHSASTRSVFAKGVLAAVAFIYEKKNGIYSMQNLIDAIII